MALSDWYIRIFIATAAFILGGTAAINLVVDPYDISRVLRWPRLNAEKVREHGFARLRKPFDIWRRHYDGIALGASQVERGIDPDNPALAARGLSLYNAGISEERPFEQALLFKHAVDVSDIRFALVSLDFLRYMGGGGRADFLPQTWTRWQALCQYLKTLVSYSGLRDSTATVAASWSRRTALQHRRDGLLNLDEVGRDDVREIRRLFDSVDALYLNTVYPRALKAYTTEGGNFDHKPLHDMLRIAHKAGVQLYFFITPSHARQFEIIHMLGLSQLYNHWVRELTSELAKDANIGPVGEPFELWDFSGYNSITTEPIAPQNTNRQMRWYFDSVHYKPSAGRLIQDRLLNFHSDDHPESMDFGIKLSVDQLDAHFQAIALARKEYLLSHPNFLLELESIYHGSQSAKFRDIDGNDARR